MSEYSFKPNVDQVQEFIEIAGDFSNPLDLVREAISNAVDAKAKQVSIIFDVTKEYGENVLVIVLQDDGIGMDQTTIRAFFDLGNSSNRGNPDAIGEKGHGTKVYSPAICCCNEMISVLLPL
jgi:sensor histidine kinase regulating citrate/malate metabolism